MDKPECLLLNNVLKITPKIISSILFLCFTEEIKACIWYFLTNSKLEHTSAYLLPPYLDGIDY